MAASIIQTGREGFTRMMGRMDHNSPQLRDEAAGWVVRLAGDTVEEADWLAFQAWLDADDEGTARRAAFDQAQSVWLALDAAPGLAFAGPRVSAPSPARSRDRSLGRAGAGRRGEATWWATGLAAAACIAAVATVSLRPGPVAPPRPMTFATGLGEHRTVWLPDGTRIDLNSASHLTVDYVVGERRVQMQQAEAAFDVKHDPSRPFVITVGDGKIRVLGTAFDVRHYDGETQVSVSRGVVQLSAQGQMIRLAQGAAASHREGEGVEVVHRSPASALAWRTGRLLYVDQPLTRVVADINRQFGRPIRLADASAARMRFTGVIVLGSQAETIHRLTALVPLQARVVGDEVVLTSRHP